MKILKEYIKRPRSIITEKDNLETLYTLQNFPVFFGCTNKPLEEDIVADMEWAIDPETGVIQLTKLIPLEILYQSQHVDGCGPTWQQYYQDFADYIFMQKPVSVLEIGGGQGVLAKLTTEKSSKMKWMIVEPNPWSEENEQIKVVASFFDENFQCDEMVDAVVFSQLLEHIYNPEAFIKNISKFLKVGGKLIFAYPNLEVWLKRKYTNAINFEHMMFLTDYFVDYLLTANDFRILDKKIYKDHSIFYTVEKTNGKLKILKYRNKYNSYKKIFMNFVNYHLKMIKQLNQKIESLKVPIYLFGAHIFSQYLIGFGLKTDKIVAILDNSPTKQGKRLYGTNLFVESPKILQGRGKAAVILKAGIYNEEIKKDILENINSEIIFW